MIEARCPTEPRGGETVAASAGAPAQECAAVRELLAGQALNTLPPDEAREVRSHLVVCPACRDELDCLATVAAHLARVRDALAGDAAPRQPTCASDRHAAGRTTPRAGRRPGRHHAGPATRLTLSQWVSRIAYAARSEGP